MDTIPNILESVAQGDKKAATELMPVLYKELRRLAVFRMAKLPSGNTLQPTANEEVLATATYTLKGSAFDTNDPNQDSFPVTGCDVDVIFSAHRMGYSYHS